MLSELATTSFSPKLHPCLVAARRFPSRCSRTPQSKKSRREKTRTKGQLSVPMSETRRLRLLYPKRHKTSFTRMKRSIKKARKPAPLKRPSALTHFRASKRTNLDKTCQDLESKRLARQKLRNNQSRKRRLLQSHLK